MKKRLLLGLSAIALFGGSLAIGITIKDSLTPVNAEGESTSVVSSESTSSSTTSSTTYNCKWYSDERCTIQVNTTGSSFSVATAGTYYAKVA